MTEITTDHYNRDTGQETIRTVTVTDATGDEYQHRFRETEDGHEYLGDGTAPESAQEAIDSLEEDLADE